MNKTDRENYWKEKYEDFKASGLKSSRWCKLNSIPTSTFTKWKKLFTSSDDSDTKFTSIKVVKENKDKEIDNSLSITIGHAKVEFKSNTCLDTFSKAVEVLNKYV